MSKKKVSKATRKKVAKSVKKAVQKKMAESAIAKLRGEIPESARSKVWLALIARISEHTAAAEKDLPATFDPRVIERSARMMECVDIAYEIGSDAERELIEEMRRKE